MSKPDTKEPKPGSAEDVDEKSAPSELNSPALDEKTGKPKNRAISSFKQAHAIAKRHFDKAKDGRLKTAAVIADKYGGSAPFKMEDLRKVGQTWRNNFSTNPLGSVIDRSTPQLTNPIKQAEYLTYSALPPERENAAEKTRKFRIRTTKLFRGWSGWASLIGQIGQEDYVFGNNAPGWIDDDWRPKAFRHDETFLPEGTGQHASQAQFIIYRQPMLLHDFLRKIEDKEVAEAAGYNWEGCIKAANEAAGLRNDSESTQLEQVDAVRENGTMGFTYEGDTKIVWLFHVLVREYEGGVNLWTVAQKGGHGVRFVENIHESMEDSATFFTLQEGNGKYYGSRGAGRQLTNLHIALDRHRNFGADKSFVAGLPIFKVKGKDMNSVQTVVRSPFMFVLGDVEMMQEVITFDSTAHEYLDKQLSGQMEAVAGAFIPPKMNDAGSSNTKIEAAQKAERELAVRDGVLGRFFGQFADMVGAMQRKVYKPENIKEAIRLFEENKAKKEKGLKVIAARVARWLKEVFSDFDKNNAPEEQSKTADADAVQCIVDLLNDGLTPEDIVELALSPAGNNSEEKPEEQDAKTVEFVQGIQGSALQPFYDMKKAAQMVGEIVIGEDRAQRLLIPDKPDPTVEAIARREQVQEWLAMMAGEMQPVAPQDEHPIHRAELLPRLGPILMTIPQAPTPEVVTTAKLLFDHYAQHVMLDMSLTPEARTAEEQQLAIWQQAIQTGEQVLAKAQAEAEKAAVEGGAGAVPPAMEGAPIQATGPNGEVAGTEGDLERERLQIETALRVGDQEIQHRKLDIEEKKLDSKNANDALTATRQTLTDVADRTQEAQRRGIEDAQKEAAAEAAAQNPDKPSI